MPVLRQIHSILQVADFVDPLQIVDSQEPWAYSHFDQLSRLIVLSRFIRTKIQKLLRTRQACNCPYARGYADGAYAGEYYCVSHEAAMIRRGPGRPPKPRPFDQPANKENLRLMRVNLELPVEKTKALRICGTRNDQSAAEAFYTLVREISPDGNYPFDFRNFRKPARKDTEFRRIVVEIPPDGVKLLQKCAAHNEHHVSEVAFFLLVALVNPDGSYRFRRRVSRKPPAAEVPQ